LGNAELHGLICSGPVEGKQQTFALLEERCPTVPRRTHDEALAELVTRYFSSRGPATLKDFSWWSGLTISEIKRALDMVPGLEELEVDGLTLYVLGAHPPPTTSGAECHLLQTFDEYVVGYTESRHAMDIAGIGGPLPNLVRGVIVLDTQVVGRWDRKIQANDVLITATSFRPLKRAETEALRTEAERFGDFLGLPIQLGVSS
jgi:hypothetical protein